MIVTTSRPLMQGIELCFERAIFSANGCRDAGLPFSVHRPLLDREALKKWRLYPWVMTACFALWRNSMLPEGGSERIGSEDLDGDVATQHHFSNHGIERMNVAEQLGVRSKERIADQPARILDSGSTMQDLGCRILDPGLWTLDPVGSRIV